MPLEAGRLRNRIKIYQRNDSQDVTTGEIIVGWSLVATVWASVEPLSVKEFVAASTTQSQISARIVIRYRTGIAADMIVVHNDETYEIKGPPLPDKNTGREYLTLMVNKVTGVYEDIT